MTQKYVLYHSNCYDGFGAAYAAWKTLGDTAEYIPVSYSKPPPIMNPGSIVYIVDFSYKRDVLIELSKQHLVVVLDHHKTAMEDLKDLNNQLNLNVTFDMNKSGAMLAWEYFHPNVNPPKLIQLIQDRDLWQFKIPGSKELHVYLQSIDFDFKQWDNTDVEKAIVQGSAITQFRDKQVEMICRNAIETTIQTPSGHVPCVVVNATAFWSEVGNHLLEKFPNSQMAASFGYMKNGKVMYSLRTRGDFDCSEVAKEFGGGGHKPAAGFESSQLVHSVL